MLRHRLSKKKTKIPYGPYKLGRWGVVINIVSIGYSIILLIFMVLPPYKPVTAENMNYSGVIFGAAMLLGVVIWWFYGRGVYKGRMREVVEGTQQHLQ